MDTVKDTKEKVKSNTTKKYFILLIGLKKMTSFTNLDLLLAASKPILYRSPSENALIGGVKRALNVTTDIGKNLFTLPSVAIGESQIAGVSQERVGYIYGHASQEKTSSSITS